MSGRRAPSARPPRTPSRHFLRSSALAAELVRDAGVGPRDLVLDLGAGGGRLTAPLAARAGRVVAVELDPRLARKLRGRWPNVEAVCADAACVPLPQRPFRVVANLPFAGTNAILRHLLDDPTTRLQRADLVVQWGVAVKRTLPWPSTVNGVAWGAWYRFRVERRLGPEAFDPPPAVDAAVLVVERRREPLVEEARWREYRAFVASAFRHGPHAVLPARLLRRHRLRSARELDAHAWAELFSAVRLPAP